MERWLLSISISLLGIYFSYFLFANKGYLKVKQQGDVPVIGSIQSVTNQVEKKPFDRFIWFNSQRQESLRPYDQIRTGHDSSAVVYLHDQDAEIFIQPDSLISFSSDQNESLISVDEGEIFVQPLVSQPDEQANVADAKLNKKNLTGVNKQDTNNQDSTKKDSKKPAKQALVIKVKDVVKRVTGATVALSRSGDGQTGKQFEIQELGGGELSDHVAPKNNDLTAADTKATADLEIKKSQSKLSVAGLKPFEELSVDEDLKNPQKIIEVTSNQVDSLVLKSGSGYSAQKLKDQKSVQSNEKVKFVLDLQDPVNYWTVEAMDENKNVLRSVSGVVRIKKNTTANPAVNNEINSNMAAASIASSQTQIGNSQVIKPTASLTLNDLSAPVVDQIAANNQGVTSNQTSNSILKVNELNSNQLSELLNELNTNSQSKSDSFNALPQVTTEAPLNATDSANLQKANSKEDQSNLTQAQALLLPSPQEVKNGIQNQDKDLVQSLKRSPSSANSKTNPNSNSNLKTIKPIIKKSLSAPKVEAVEVELDAGLRESNLSESNVNETANQNQSSEAP